MNNWRLKLDNNENIYGTFNSALSVLKNIHPDKINFLDDENHLKEKFSKKYDLDIQNVVFSISSYDTIYTILNMFSKGDNENIFCSYLDEKYKKRLEDDNFKIIYSNFENYFSFSYENIEKHINQNTKVIYVETPNNQTGENIRASYLELLIKKYQDIIFLINLDYVTYSNISSFEDYVDLIKKYTNVIIMKSYSFDCAISGLNFNLILTTSSLAKNIEENLFNKVDSVSLNVMSIVLNDKKNIERIKELNNQVKKYFIEELNNRNIKTFDSEANFILCNFEKYCNFYYEKFLKYKILTKKYSHNSPYPNCLRITIPTLGGTKFLLELLNKKDLIVFRFEEIFSDENNILIKKEILEELKEYFDIALISNKTNYETKEYLEKIELDKYFYYYVSKDENEIENQEIKQIREIVEYCPHNKITLFTNIINDVISRNEVDSDIEIVSFIPDKIKDENFMINNFKHLGIEKILVGDSSLATYLKDILKNK